MIWVENEGGKKEIIDGQQRLTSLSLCLAAIRDKLEEIHKKNPFVDTDRIADLENLKRMLINIFV